MKDKIVILRGPDRVRRRPAVIFGDDDATGAAAALHMLLDILSKEGLNGHCNQITLTQFADDSIEIRDNGRGIFLGSDDTIWRGLFCELYAAPLCDDGATARCIFEGPSGKPGECTDSLDICSVQYASEYMDVTVVRDGFKQTLHFEKGYNIGGLSKAPCAEHTGTCIRFKLDTEVFSSISIPGQQIADLLQAIAIQLPGMSATFRQETDGALEETVFCYPNGVADYLQRENENCEALPIYHNELTAEGQERYNLPRYAAEVKTHICFAENRGFIKCYHNLKELTHGGTHCDIALTEIRQYLEWRINCKISEEDLLKHLQLVIITNAEISCWVNGARTGIANTLIRDMTHDTIGSDFQYFVKQNAPALNALYGN